MKKEFVHYKKDHAFQKILKGEFDSGRRNKERRIGYILD